MAKPEPYKAADGVKLKCLRTYKVDDGTKDPVTFEAGKEYVVAPRSAVHLLRQTYAAHDEPSGKAPRQDVPRRGPFFVDAKADAEQKAADDAAKKERAARAGSATEGKGTTSKAAAGKAAAEKANEGS